MPKGDGRLRNASNNGELARVAALLRQGGDPNALGEHGRSALFLAVANGHAAVVESLLRAGADPCARAPGELCPLSKAVTQRRLDLVALMLGSAGGRRLRCLDDALGWAIIGADCEAVELLAAHGADVGGRGTSGGPSPLERARWWLNEAHPASKQQFGRVVDLLLRLGAT